MFESLFSLQVGLIFFQTLIMLCAIFLLKRYAWKFLLNFMQKEEEAYEKAAKDSAFARKTANQLRALSNKIIDKANERSRQIIDAGMATKEALLEEARLEASEERARMIERAKEDILKKERASRQQLKGEAALLVVHATQKLLGLTLENAHMQERLAQRLIEEAMGKRHGKAT